MFRFLASLALGLVTFALPAGAECVGQNLMSAMTDADRSALMARAHSVPHACWGQNAVNQNTAAAGVYDDFVTL